MRWTRNLDWKQWPSVEEKAANGNAIVEGEFRIEDGSWVGTKARRHGWAVCEQETIRILEQVWWLGDE